jgi:hypothetical protein
MPLWHAPKIQRGGQPCGSIGGKVKFSREDALVEETSGLIIDYLNNPCTATAASMYESLFKWPREVKGKHQGTALAIINECMRHGNISRWHPGALLPRLWLRWSMLWTYESKTWDDFLGLEWTFTRSPRLVRELHERCHARGAHKHACITVGSLLSDDEFEPLFRSLVVDKCPECMIAFGDRFHVEVPE